MTRHTVPRATPDRACAGCGLLKAAERFPRGSGGRRLTVCETCSARKNAPRPCARCGAATAPEAFPTLPSGRPSKFCGPCKEAGLPDRPCSACGQTLPASQFFRYPNAQRSRTCEGCRQVHERTARCRQCKRTLPTSAFHRYANHNRAASCADCRRARPHGPKGVNTAPHPCSVCGGPIRFDIPPSHLAARKTCSPACNLAGRRQQHRTCTRCKRRLPFEAYDRKEGSRNRRGACRECRADATDDRRPDLALRPSIHCLGVNLRRAAERRGVKYGLGLTELRRLHASPCALCANAVSTVILTTPAHGYILPNCRPVCRLCARLLRLAPWGEIVLHANQVAAHTPLDPDRPGGCARCRCTRLRASASCEPGTPPDGS